MSDRDRQKEPATRPVVRNYFREANLPVARNAFEGLGKGIESRVKSGTNTKLPITDSPTSRVPVPARNTANRKRTRPRQETDLLDEYQVAGMLAVSVSTIRRWRLLGREPRFLKIGSSVRYKTETVKKWMDSRESGGGR